MENTSSVLYSHDPNTGACCDSYEHIPQFSTLFKIYFNSILSYTHRQNDPFPSGFPENILICTFKIILLSRKTPSHFAYILI